MYWLISVSLDIWEDMCFLWFFHMVRSFSKSFINSVHQIFTEHQRCAKYLTWLGSGDIHLNTTSLELAFCHQEDTGSKWVKRNRGLLAGWDIARRKLGKWTSECRFELSGGDSQAKWAGVRMRWRHVKGLGRFICRRLQARDRTGALGEGACEEEVLHGHGSQLWRASHAVFSICHSFSRYVLSTH